MNIVCFGDSVTHARKFAECDRWPTRLGIKLDEWTPGRFKVYNRGVGGDSTERGLHRFGDDIVPLLPAVLLVEFGFNDAYILPWTRKARIGLDEFKANLREIHRAVHAHKGTCVFIMNHTIGPLAQRWANGKSRKTNFLPYNEAIKKVAAQLRAPMIDLPAMMKKRRVSAGRFTSDDNLHLSIEGNHIYADMVFDALKPIVESG